MFEASTRSVDLLERLGSFIDEAIEPAARGIDEARAAEPSVQPPQISELQQAARSAGLWNLNVRNADWGPGLTSSEYAPLAERLGTSRLAQEITNTDAPSSINGDALIAYGTELQFDRWLRPQLDGQIRSAFAMTEPDVASSDASNISLAATQDGDGWRLDGRKWWISGVQHPNCAYLMVMACTDPEASRHLRHTVFLVPTDSPGLRIVRNLPKFGYLDEDGHCELEFDGVQVGQDDVLGQLGGGFAIGQARLGPARVQHCMRTLGIAEAALTLMCQRAQSRTTFGALVSSRANVGDWIAESRIAIDAARLMVLRTAHVMDTQGDKAAAPEMSAIKVAVLRAATDVVDRAIQVHGAAGVSDDTPLARWYASLRALRIADGPDEVHLMAIARRELRSQAN